MRIEPGSPTDAGTLARLNPFVHDLHLEHAPHVVGSSTREEAAARRGGHLGLQRSRTGVLRLAPVPREDPALLDHASARGGLSPDTERAGDGDRRVSSG
jgi:hypothetical protein